jgi:pimeloyl-ACP methyl ester carboxylesterase
MPTVKANDINIYYEVHGQGEPLLMIQGLSNYSGHWTTLLPPFAEKYRAIIFDNRGTGRTDKPETPYTMEMMAADAKGVLDAIGIDKANVLGVSMGGMIAQEFALDYPDTVINLILGCTSCGGKHGLPPTAESIAFLGNPERAKLSVEQRARDTAPWLWTKGFIDKHPEAVDRYVAVTMKYPTPLHGLANQMQAVAGGDTYERLPRIKSPTLVIAGDSDRLIPFENSNIIASRIPGAELVVIPNAGHAFTEAPEAITAMLDFLKRHPGGKK